MNTTNVKFRGKPQNQAMNVGRIIFDLFLYALVLYFVYHALQGDRGYFAYQDLSKEYMIQQKALAELEQEKLLYEKKLQLINNKQVDLDLLDELARSKLGLVQSNELMVILKN